MSILMLYSIVKFAIKLFRLFNSRTTTLLCIYPRKKETWIFKTHMCPSKCLNGQVCN